MLYAVLSALGVVLIRKIGLQEPDMLIIFLSTSYSILVFNMLIAKQAVPTYLRVVRFHKKPYFKLSLTLLVSWTGTFLIPIYFSPSALLFTFMSILSIGGCIGTYRSTKSTPELVKAVLLSLNLLGYYALSATVYHGWTFAAFIASTMVVGYAGIVNNRNAAGMLGYGFTSKQVVAIRFWLLWSVGLAFVLADHLLSHITPELMLSTAAIGLISMILPMYFLQKAIEKIGPDRTGIFMGFTPLVVVAFEYFFFQEWDLLTVIPVAILPLVIIGCSMYQRSRNSLSTA